MKKILFMITFLLLLSGCGKPSTENSVAEYLSKQYPTETFTILSKTEANASRTGGNVSGWEYRVKSNETNIEFLVSDSYGEVGGGWKSYELRDDYLSKAMEKYIKDFGDNRIHIDYLRTGSVSVVLQIDTTEFNSIEELSKVIYSFKTFYEEKKPFLDGASRVSYVNIWIYKSGELKKYITSVHIMSESEIYDSIKNY